MNTENNFFEIALYMMCGNVKEISEDSDDMHTEIMMKMYDIYDCMDKILDIASLNNASIKKDINKDEKLGIQALKLDIQALKENEMMIVYLFRLIRFLDEAIELFDYNKKHIVKLIIVQRLAQFILCFLKNDETRKCATRHLVSLIFDDLEDKKQKQLERYNNIAILAEKVRAENFEYNITVDNLKKILQEYKKIKKIFTTLRTIKCIIEDLTGEAYDMK